MPFENKKYQKQPKKLKNRAKMAPKSVPLKKHVLFRKQQAYLNAWQKPIARFPLLHRGLKKAINVIKSKFLVI